MEPENKGITKDFKLSNTAFVVDKSFMFDEYKVIAYREEYVKDFIKKIKKFLDKSHELDNVNRIKDCKHKNCWYKKFYKKIDQLAGERLI